MRLSKKFLLLNLMLIIFVGCRKSDQQKHQPEPNPLLLISFDGFRYDYLSKTATPNFDSFIVNGVKAKRLIPVFPTLTFPNHYSIATGLYPENSGLVGNTMYDPNLTTGTEFRTTRLSPMPSGITANQSGTPLKNRA